MTNRDRTIAMLGFTPDENGVQAELMDLGINALSTYDPVNYSKINRAARKLIEVILSTPDTSNSITGFGVSYDRRALEVRLKLLREEEGFTTTSIKSVTHRW